MLLIRLRSIVAVVVFSAGVFAGYFIARPWLVFWYKNRLVIFGDPAMITPGAVGKYLGKKNSARSPRILCMVLSQLQGAKAQSVYETWGRRCNEIFFVTSHHLDSLPTVVPPTINESRDALWAKVVYGFSSAYSNYYNKTDWFLKADDDTYVVMDNLRSLLARYDTLQPVYFGCRFETGYMSGGAGYVMSKVALQMFVEASWKKRECKSGVSDSEDVNMGNCLNNMQVKPIDTRDIFGRERFLIALPFKDGAFIPGHIPHDYWYWTLMHYPVNDWFDCCAESAITFHYVEAVDMVIIDFFLYHLSPFLR